MPSTPVQTPQQKKLGGAALDTPSKSAISPLPSGYEKISGAKYPTAAAQKAAYSDIKMSGKAGQPGSYLYGKPIQQTSTIPPASVPTPAAPPPPTPFEQYQQKVTDSYKAPPQEAQMQQLQSDYLDKISQLYQPSAAQLDAQAKLNALSQQQANLAASEQLGLNKIKEQPIELGLQVGQGAALQRQAEAQMAALAGQATPLQSILAQEQARLQTARDAAQTAYGVQTGGLQRAEDIYNNQQAAQRQLAQMQYQKETPAPVTLAAGASLFNPVTGKEIASAAPKGNFQVIPANKYHGEQIVDKNTGKIISTSGGPVSGVSSDSSSSSSSISSSGVVEKGSPADLASKVIEGKLALSKIKGTGKNSLQSQVLKEIYKQDPNFDEVASEANYAATQKAVGENAVQYRNTIKLEGSAEKSLDDLLAASKKVGLGSVPAINSAMLPLRQGKGDQDVSTYMSMLEEVRSQAANVLGGGSVTDQSRHQAELMLPANVSPSTMEKNIQAIKKLMKNKVDELRSMSDIPKLPTDGSQQDTSPDLATIKNQYGISY